MSKGVGLFENIKKEKLRVEILKSVSSSMVTHLFYKIKNSKNWLLRLRTNFSLYDLVSYTIVS